MNPRMLLVAMIGLLFLSVPVMAIGIGPGRIEAHFEPNFESNYDFHVANHGDTPLNVMLYASGDLAEYITVEKGTFIVQPNEIKHFNFYVKLPEELDPGKHDTRVGVVEIAPSDGMVAAVAGVEMQYWVYVDYPEKYISVEIANTDPRVQESMIFNVTLFNPVNTSLTSSADLDILKIEEEGEVLVERFDFGGIDLESGHTHTFHAYWRPTTAGDYKAVSRTYYDGGTTRKEINFEVAVPESPVIPSETKPPEEIVEETISTIISPYTALIIILIILIVGVLLWPEEKKGGDR